MARYEPNFGGEPRPWLEVVAMVVVGLGYIVVMAWVLYMAVSFFLFP